MTMVMSKPWGHGMFLRVHISFTMSHAYVQLLASQLNMICCMDSIVLHVWQRPQSLRFFIFSQYWPHLWALCLSFHMKVLTLVDRSHLFFMAVIQILSFEGCEPSRSYVASLMRSRLGMVFLLRVRGLGWDLRMRE